MVSVMYGGVMYGGDDVLRGVMYGGDDVWWG